MTMPKSQFKSVQQVHGGTANVSGTLTPDAAQSGPHGTQFVHWVLAQGDNVAAGLAPFEPSATAWQSQGSAPLDWNPGPAQAAGVILTITPAHTDPEPAPVVVEAFTWSQEVMLQLS
jgi:hypothetical protein